MVSRIDSKLFQFRRVCKTWKVVLESLVNSIDLKSAILISNNQFIGATFKWSKIDKLFIQPDNVPLLLDLSNQVVIGRSKYGIRKQTPPTLITSSPPNAHIVNTLASQFNTLPSNIQFTIISVQQYENITKGKKNIQQQEVNQEYQSSRPSRITKRNNKVRFNLPALSTPMKFTKQ